MTASPCNSVCRMDPARGLCIGCCRTLDEIARWAAMDDGERAQVLAAIAVRQGAPGTDVAPAP